MKVTILIGLISLFVFSCAHKESISIDNRPSTYRAKASRSLASDHDCIEILNNVVKSKKTINRPEVPVESGTRLRNKRRRTKEIKEGLETGDNKKILDQIFKSHDNNNRPHDYKERLKGRDQKKENLLWRRRRETETLYVPAYFQNSAYETEPTYNVIIHLIGDQDQVSNAQKSEAIKTVAEWLENYKGYSDRISKQVSIATEAKSNATIGRKILDDAKAGKFKGKDFSKLQFRYLRETNNYEIINDPSIKARDYSDVFRPRSIGALESRVQAAEAKVEATFASNYFGDKYDKGNINKLMREHAVVYRRLQLAAFGLAERTPSELSESALKLREEIISVLEDNRFLRPRSDKVAKLQKRELKAEWNAKWRFFKSKRVIDDQKFPLPPEIKEKLEGVSLPALIARYASIGFAVSASTAIATFVTLPFEDMPEVGWFFAYMNNMLNDFQLSVFGTTKPLIACEKSLRDWSLVEGSDMDNFVRSHLDRFIFEAEIAGDNYVEPKWVTKRRKELIDLCLSKRAEAGEAEFRALTKEEIPAGRRRVLHEMFLGQFKSNYKGNYSSIGPVMVELLEANNVFAEETEENGKRSELSDAEKVALEKLKALDPDAAKTARDYIFEVPSAISILKQYGSLPSATDLDQFLKNIKEGQ